MPVPGDVVNGSRSTPSGKEPSNRSGSSEPAEYDAASPRLAFNRVGAGIEIQLRDNPIVAWMRATNRRELESVFSPASTLLEIGCGSGADAVSFAKRGIRVVATDISDQMIEATRDGARAQGVAGSVLALRGRLSELFEELSAMPWAPFDGAYANFSLTYEESLRSIASLVHSLVRPGARFVFTLPNRLCFTEPLIALARLRPFAVFDRFREPRWLVIRDVRVRVRAYTVGEVRRALRGLFEIEQYRGLPVFMPPSRLYDPSRDRLVRELGELDNRWDRSPPWRWLGDTTLFRARRIE